jgi:hypothetical protein
MPGPHLTYSHSQRTNDAGARFIVALMSLLELRGWREEGGGTHLGLLILGIVLPVDVARGRLIRDAERGVTDLGREVVLEVEEARLAYVARLCAGLAHHGRFETHAGTRIPTEDGERAGARPAFASEFLF